MTTINTDGSISLDTQANNDSYFANQDVWIKTYKFNWNGTARQGETIGSRSYNVTDTMPIDGLIPSKYSLPIPYDLPKFVPYFFYDEYTPNSNYRIFFYPYYNVKTNPNHTLFAGNVYYHNGTEYVCTVLELKTPCGNIAPEETNLGGLLPYTIASYHLAVEPFQSPIYPTVLGVRVKDALPTDHTLYEFLGVDNMFTNWGDIGNYGGVGVNSAARTMASPSGSVCQYEYYPIYADHSLGPDDRRLLRCYPYVGATQYVLPRSILYSPSLDTFYLTDRLNNQFGGSQHAHNRALPVGYQMTLTHQFCCEEYNTYICTPPYGYFDVNPYSRYQRGIRSAKIIWYDRSGNIIDLGTETDPNDGSAYSKNYVTPTSVTQTTDLLVSSTLTDPVFGLSPNRCYAYEILVTYPGTAPPGAAYYRPVLEYSSAKPASQASYFDTTMQLGWESETIITRGGSYRPGWLAKL